MPTTITTAVLKKLVWPKGHTNAYRDIDSMTTNTFKLNFSKTGRAKRKSWIKNLIRDFAEEHDCNPSASIVVNYICTPNGCQEFAKWLLTQGFTVSYWELKPYIEVDHEQREHLTYVGFGLEFKNNCEHLVQYKLTHGQDSDEN